MLIVYLNSISGTRDRDPSAGSDPADLIEIDWFSADVFFTLLPLDEDPPQVIE
jgi:hypothetical protein